MGRAKGKVAVTVYLPEKLWESIRSLAPDLPTGKKKVSDIITRLLVLGLEAYGARGYQEEASESEMSGEAGKKEGEKEVYEVEVEGVKLFLRPVS